MTSKVVEFRHKSVRPGAKAPPVSSEVAELGGHSDMTPREALEISIRQNPDNILILHIYENKDGNEEFAMSSSQMTNAQALYLIERAKISILGG